MLNAIPFIVASPEGYRITIEAEEFLQSTKGCLAVLGVLGKYRTGKSFLLNRVILNTQQGFQTGQTINACTTGIWMYPKIVNYENAANETVSVLVLDSEGLASTENASNDKNICALMLLLCSFLVYNSFHNIDEAALAQISLMSNLTKDLRLHADRETQASELAQVFPTFCWLLRDFALSLEDTSGNRLDAQSYMENVLKQGSSEIAETANAEKAAARSIRETIRECFPNRMCFTMSRPCQEENDLRALNSLQWSRMRSVFVEEVEEFRKLLHNNVKTKVFDGNPLSGPMLLMIAKHFIEAINNGALPVLDDSYKMLSEIKDSENANIALDLFEQNVRTIAQGTGTIASQEHLFTKLSEWKRLAILYFRQRCRNAKDNSHLLRLEKSLSLRFESCLESNLTNLQICLSGHVQSLQLQTVPLQHLEHVWMEKTQDIRSKFGTDPSVLALWYEYSVEQFLKRFASCQEQSELIQDLQTKVATTQRQAIEFAELSEIHATALQKLQSLEDELAAIQELVESQKSNIAENVCLQMELTASKQHAEVLETQLTAARSSLKSAETDFVAFCETTRADTAKKLKEQREFAQEQIGILKKEIGLLKTCEAEHVKSLEMKDVELAKSQEKRQEQDAVFQETKQMLVAKEQELRLLQTSHAKLRNEWNDGKRESETQLVCLRMERDGLKRRVEESEEDAKLAKKLKIENMRLSSEKEGQKKFQEFLEKDKLSRDAQVRDLQSAKQQLEEMLTHSQHQREMDRVKFEMAQPN